MTGSKGSRLHLPINCLQFNPIESDCGKCWRLGVLGSFLGPWDLARVDRQILAALLQNGLDQTGTKDARLTTTRLPEQSPTRHWGANSEMVSGNRRSRDYMTHLSDLSARRAGNPERQYSGDSLCLLEVGVLWAAKTPISTILARLSVHDMDRSTLYGMCSLPRCVEPVQTA